MGLRINQNITALNAFRNLSITDVQMSKSLEKLSSGFRINRAGDDAAGLVVSENLRSQVGGLKVASRNAQDGISVVQTAEGALTEVHAMLQRMRDLAVQASSTAAQDSTAKTAAQTELAALRTEINRIGAAAKFGNQSLLGGNYGVTAATTGTTAPALATGNPNAIDAGDTFLMTFSGNTAATAVGAVTFTMPAVTANTAVGTLATTLQSAINVALATGNSDQQALAGKVSVTANAASKLVVSVTGLEALGTFAFTAGTGTLADVGLNGLTVTAAAGTAASVQVGANANQTIDLTIGAVSSTSLDIATVDLTTDAAGAITTIDAAIAIISSQRASLGAFQNRLEYALANVNTTIENLSASESRIRDTDMAQEMTSFSRAQILAQAGTAMLAQANQSTQNILTLFR